MTIRRVLAHLRLFATGIAVVVVLMTLWQVGLWSYARYQEFVIMRAVIGQAIQQAQLEHERSIAVPSVSAVPSDGDGWRMGDPAPIRMSPDNSSRK